MISAEVAAKFAELNASVSAEAAQVKSKIDGLAAEIVELRALVEAGSNPAELLVALDQLKANVEAIYTPDAEPVE